MFFKSDENIRVDHQSHGFVSAGNSALDSSLRMSCVKMARHPRLMPEGFAGIRPIHPPLTRKGRSSSIVTRTSECLRRQIQRFGRLQNSILKSCRKGHRREKSLSLPFSNNANKLHLGIADRISPLKGARHRDLTDLHVDSTRLIPRYRLESPSAINAERSANRDAEDSSGSREPALTPSQTPRERSILAQTLLHKD